MMGTMMTPDILERNASPQASAAKHSRPQVTRCSSSQTAESAPRVHPVWYQYLLKLLAADVSPDQF